MTTSNRSRLERAAAFVFTVLSMSATTTLAGPMFYPKPGASRLPTQDMYMEGCAGNACFNLFAQIFGGEGGVSVTEYGDGGYRSFSCPLKSGELDVRDDGAQATLNLTIDAVNCDVTVQCDDQGVCTPDYQGTINVAASLRRPAGSNIVSSQYKAKAPDGTSSTFACQEKSGYSFLEGAVAIHGHSMVVETSGASNRNCTEVIRLR